MFEDLAEKYAAIYDYIALPYQNEESISREEILLRIDNAWRAIVKYMWCDYETDFNSTYYTPVILLSRAYISNAIRQKAANDGDREVTQMSEGSRSVTFKSGFITLDSSGLTEEVKAALPPRKLRVI